jgi:hypothetical protein
MYTFYSENFEEGDHLHGLGVDRRIILKWALKM